MKWFCTVLFLCTIIGVAHTGAQEKAAGAFIKVEVKGKLETGVVAIGAETTGTTITAGRVTWELDVKNAKLKKLLPSLDGKTVVVKGTLTRRDGVEVGQRWIVTVTSLEAADRSAPPKK